MGELRYCFSFLSCKIFLLSIILFSSQANTSLAQNDYKISTEGFVFKNPTKDNVTLAVYFSVVNIGAVSDFYGPLRNIKLSYMQSGSRQTTRHIDSRIVMRDDNEESHYAIVELLYNIPRTVTQLKISSPDHPVSDAPIVESIIYEKSFNDYEKTGGKDIVYEDGRKSNNRDNTTYIQALTLNKYCGGMTGIGVSIGEKGDVLGLLEVSVYPKFLLFGKNNDFSFTGNITWSGKFTRHSDSFSYRESYYGVGLALRYFTTTWNHSFIGVGLNYGFSSDGKFEFENPTPRVDFILNFLGTSYLKYSIFFQQNNNHFSSNLLQHFLIIGLGGF